MARIDTYKNILFHFHIPATLKRKLVTNQKLSELDIELLSSKAKNLVKETDKLKVNLKAYQIKNK
jgi:hypothetical protein|tara:strand:+ start:718 stop:912 length:195 start_codon:yes stop_codon:yes gene_type:complete